MTMFDRCGLWLFGAAVCAFSATVLAADGFVIEDGESGKAAAYYEERPPLLENTYDKATQGSQSLHFRTAGDDGHSLITKFHWPTARDFSAFAADGVVSFDLWLANPRDMKDSAMGARMEFTLMSRSNDKKASWYIGSSLFKPQTWNTVRLALKDGKAILAGSSVNGIALATDGQSMVENTGINWRGVDYHRFAFPHQGAAVEAYLDNVVIAGREDATAHKIVALGDSDPVSHLRQIEKKLQPKYDIIPPDVNSKSFFTDALINFDQIRNWKAALYGVDGVFCRSKDQAIRGVPNVKVEVRRTGGEAKIVLRPPQPIRIGRDFDTIDCWIYTYGHGGVLGLTFKLPDGTPFTWRGGNATYNAPGALQFWTLAHVVLPQTLRAGSELTAIEITPPDGKKGDTYLYHLDQLRVSRLSEYLKRPAPQLPHIGPVVKIPVDDNGACPKTTAKVTTSLEEKDGKDYFTYTGDAEGTVRYVYAPATGTLADLTVEAAGIKPFKPADGSGPVFDFKGTNCDAAARGCRVKLVSRRIQGQVLAVVWRYSCPQGEESIEYHLSLKGKTLQIQAASTATALAAWKTGFASGLTDAKVVELPFMFNSPNVLCNAGMFISYYFDWYKSNTSAFSYVPDNEVRGDIARYNFREGLVYAKRPDGSRHPFQETFYLTASGNFDDVMLSISNPTTPYRDAVKERLFHMIGPPDGFMKTTRATIDLYDKYGITKVYWMFHAGLWSSRGGRGPEPWTGRMTVSYAHEAEGGDAAFIDLMKYIAAKGIYPGYYDGYSSLEPVDSLWNYDWMALLPDGNWCPTWVQCYRQKPWVFPEMAATAFKVRAEKYKPRVGYQDGWTANALFECNDYDPRYPESGKLIDTIRALGTGFARSRENYDGPVFSEGRGSDFYTAGLDDGDYSKLKHFMNGKSPEANRVELLADFVLKKIHPLNSSISVNLGYWGYANCGLDGAGFKYLHQFLATQIAFGTIGMLEPYTTLHANPKTNFDVTLASYYLMQQLQKRYMLEEVRDIEYFDGEKLISTSQAILRDVYKDNRLRIRYKNGLVIYVNGNWDRKNWTVRDDGRDYVLPPGGWLARQGKEFLEFSALLDGRRVDYVDSPAYRYLDAHGTRASVDGFEAERIRIRFKEGSRAGTEVLFPEKE